MSIASICNIAAWILCGVVGFLLFSDFIRTEMYFAKQKKEQASKEEVAQNETAE
jgi:hypothetical protein